MYIVRPQYE